MPSTSRFIVPVHNPGKVLWKLLDHLKSISDISLAEFIVVDDGSTDGTGEWLRSNCPEVQCIRGDGTLFWTGSMARGMSHALEENATFIFWLNHDCRPDAGAASALRSALNMPGVGCAGAWCRIAGFPEWPINPGVYKNKIIQNPQSDRIHSVDGLNGNFVGFTASAILDVGLPDYRRFVHYGDVTYTLRIHQAGYRVVVVTEARADLDYEVERRLPPKLRVALSTVSVRHWLQYYLFSIKSRYHWKTAFYESVAFRDKFAMFSYLKKQFAMFYGVFAGAIIRKICARETVLGMCKKYCRGKMPFKKLIKELLCQQM